MKRLHFFQLIIFVLVVFINANCKKEPAFDNTTGIVVTPPTTNTSPRANAGLDKQFILPINSCLLTGYASDKENNINRVQWSKISGPVSFLIDEPNSISTYVRNLEVGVYQFELTVTDAGGLSGKDTVTVAVSQISTTPGEIIFSNLIWGDQGLFGTLLWGSAILIPNIYQYVPAGKIFRVFIRKNSSSSWEELFFNEDSFYGVKLVNGTLIIWSTYDETEFVEIKLVY